MKKLSALAVVLAVALPVSGAYAVDANAKAGATGSMATNGMAAETDATATGSVSADANYGSLISTLNASKGMTDVSGIAADADIQVVKLSSLKAEANTKALDNALDKNKESVSSLQASINSDTEFKTALEAKLQAEGVALDDVVAVSTAADGKVIVYVDDRA